MKDDRLYLGHILEAIERIVLYAQDGEERFRTDVRTQDAIIRNLQVMGEAVKKVSAEARDAHPEIPWKDVAGMRDRVVHDYFGISLDIVWNPSSITFRRSGTRFGGRSLRNRSGRVWQGAPWSPVSGPGSRSCSTGHGAAGAGAQRVAVTRWTCGWAP